MRSGGVAPSSQSPHVRRPHIQFKFKIESKRLKDVHHKSDMINIPFDFQEKPRNKISELRSDHHTSNELINPSEMC